MVSDDEQPSSGSARSTDGAGTRLHYESTGRGPAVLLVMGYGMSLRQWWRTVPVLARTFRVLTFDNRGIGGSAPSASPYSVATMADDAIAVLDAAGERRAHVYGLSLGGMIAQEIALRHPDRVRALVLGATTPGGLEAIAGDDAALSFFSRSTVLTSEETAWAAVPYLYAETTRRRHAQRIADDVARRADERSTPLTQVQQLMAVVTHRAASRLGDIAAPTLVVHGREDRIVPAANGRLLAAGIAQAELKLWRGAGHFYITDEPRADAHIARFLLRHTPERNAAGRLFARAAMSRSRTWARLREAAASE